MKTIFTAAAALALFAGLALPGSAAPHRHAARTRHAAHPQSVAAVRARVSQQTIDGVTDALRQRADFYWHHGDYDSVAFVSEMIVRLDPSDEESWSNLGWILWAGLYRDADAERALKRGIAANPRSWSLMFDLGNLRFRLKRYADSVRTLRRATQVGGPAVVWNEYAHALEKSGNVAGAAHIWTRMKTTFPGWQTSQVNLDRMRRHGLWPPGSAMPAAPGPAPAGAPNAAAGSQTPGKAARPALDPSKLHIEVTNPD